MFPLRSPFLDCTAAFTPSPPGWGKNRLSQVLIFHPPASAFNGSFFTISVLTKFHLQTHLSLLFHPYPGTSEMPCSPPPSPPTTTCGSSPSTTGGATPDLFPLLPRDHSPVGEAVSHLHIFQSRGLCWLSQLGVSSTPRDTGHRLGVTALQTDCAQSTGETLSFQLLTC